MTHKPRLQSCILAALVLFISTLAVRKGAFPDELLAKPYPHIELFPENIMKPYDSFDFPWIEEPAEFLPSNFQYILKPFFTQSFPEIC